MVSILHTFKQALLIDMIYDSLRLLGLLAFWLSQLGDGGVNDIII